MHFLFFDMLVKMKISKTQYKILECCLRNGGNSTYVQVNGFGGTLASINAMVRRGLLRKTPHGKGDFRITKIGKLEHYKNLRKGNTQTAYRGLIDIRTIK